MSGRRFSGSAAESPSDFGTDKSGIAARWHEELNMAKRECAPWWDRAREILDRYRDEGPGRRGFGAQASLGSRMNILWSNVQTLAPAIYAATPEPVVQRRYGDEDDVARVASTILQRVISYELVGENDFDQIARECVLDNLLAGRGTVWLRYEPHFDKGPPDLQSLLAPNPAPLTPAAGPVPLPPAPPPQTPGAPAQAAGAPPGPPPGGAPVGPPTGSPQQPIPGQPPAGLNPAGAPPQPLTGGPALGTVPPVSPNSAAPAGGPSGPPPAPPAAPPIMPQSLPAAPAPMPPPVMPGPIPIGGLLDGSRGAPRPGDPKDGGVQIADDGEQDAQYLAWEAVKIDHVGWEDFLTNPARTWAEVRWVGRRVYMTQDEGVHRFGAKFKDVPLSWRPSDLEQAEALMPEHQVFCRAEVYEIWDKPTRRVLWLANEYLESTLDECDDPLQLPDFFPCPRPLYATLTTDTLVPVPDYHEYRDQASEIDNLTSRISAVTRAVKVAGVYDAAQEGIQRVFQEGIENQLIPVNQWGSFAEQGGLKGCMDLLDIGTLTEVLAKLVETRAQAKQDLYEVTGISDIIRGTTAASETATAQQIKSQFGTMRLRARQGEVARFCRDTIRLVAEIVCEHFHPRTLLAISDIAQEQGPDARLALPAIMLLKDDKTRPLRIDIETDSTILSDQQTEQQQRIQFLTMASQFLQQALPATQQYPSIAPLLGQMLLFGIRSFPQASELEGAFEQAIKQLQQAPAQGPPPDPKMLAAQAQMQNVQSQIASRQQDSARADRDMQAKLSIAAGKTAVEKQRADNDQAEGAVRLLHDHVVEHENALLEAAKLRLEAERPRTAAR